LTFVLAISGCDSHFTSELRRYHYRVKPEQPAYEIFSVKHRFQQFKSRMPLQENLRTQLQYRVYTLDNFFCFAFSVLHFIFFSYFFCFFFARIFHHVLPESGGRPTPSPPGSYTNDGGHCVPHFLFSDCVVPTYDQTTLSKITKIGATRCQILWQKAPHLIPQTLLGSLQHSPRLCF